MNSAFKKPTAVDEPANLEFLLYNFSPNAQYLPQVIKNVDISIGVFY